MGIQPRAIPITALLAPSSLRRVRHHLAAIHPDLLHTHLAYADTLGGVAAATLGVPAVCTLHATSGEPGARQWVKDRMAAAVRRRCHARILAVSEAARSEYLRHGWDSAGRVVVVPNGIADRPRPGAGRAVRAELGLPPEAFVVGTLSALRPEKAHAVAIEAIRLLAPAHQELRLLVVGDGPCRPELELCATDLGPVVTFAGHREDVMEVLDAIDVLVHPSRQDGFPTALLEALAARVPVVASAVGGIPEIVVGNHNGLLVDARPDAGSVAAALSSLLGDVALRERLADAGRSRFEARFGVDSWIERVRDVYDDVLAISPRPSRRQRGCPWRRVP